MGTVNVYSGAGTLYRGNEAIVDVRFTETRRTAAKSESSEYKITPAYGIIDMNLGPLILKPVKGAPVQIVIRRTDGKDYFADPVS